MKNALKGTVAATIPVSGFPTIVPASVIGKNGPSNQVNVGAIGNGRISRDHDMPGVLRTNHGRIVAVCDLDKKRVQSAKTLVNDYYSKKTGKTYDGVKFVAENGSWLMLRGSGTEPILRIYAEAKSGRDAKKLVEEGVALTKRV